MKFDDLSNSFVSPVRPTLLGLTLLPLSLGHYLHMKSCGCAYADDTVTTADMVDLIIGVLVCSMTYEEWEAFVKSDKFYDEIKAWGKKIKKYCEKNKMFNIYSVMADFQQYLEDGTKTPYVEMIKTNGSSPKTSNTHWSLHLHTALISKLNYANSEALNEPLTKMFHSYFQYLEFEGAVSFENTPTEQYLEFVAAESELKNKLKKELV